MNENLRGLGRTRNSGKCLVNMVGVSVFRFRVDSSSVTPITGLMRITQLEFVRIMNLKLNFLVDLQTQLLHFWILFVD